MVVERVSTRCCITGGGPAGMMLGYLLARAGVDVLVLEKHADFLRDFRGDTIHPSTLEVLHELGLLEAFLQLPVQRTPEVRAVMNGRAFRVADFRKLATRCGFIALIPQWDFLNFLASHAARFPGFRLRMRWTAADLLRDGDRVTGVVAETPKGPIQVGADLVVAADGRHSTLRARAGFAVEELGAPMDVLWFRLSRAPQDPDESLAHFDAGRIFVRLNRGEHWQCGYVIAKGTLEQVRGGGLAAFRAKVAALMPFAADRVGEIASWEDVKLLTVQVDRLREWSKPGLLCIGDAAHAMSPVGGVGINLAIQDAVAAANLLAPALRQGAPDPALLRQVQRRRDFPTRVTQRLQLIAQRRVITPLLAAGAELKPPLALRLLDRSAWLRRIPARIVGLGVRPEHVRSPAAAAPTARTPPGAGSSAPRLG